MKKFEVGKVYQQMSRDGSVFAEFTPLFLTEKNTFGTWTRFGNPLDFQECALPHRYLNETFENNPGLTWYREKPPEPESIELFVNIYKDKNGKLSSGGVHYCQSKADLANNYDGRDRISTAYIKFTEPQK